MLRLGRADVGDAATLLVFTYAESVPDLIRACPKSDTIFQGPIKRSAIRRGAPIIGSHLKFQMVH